MSTMDTIKRGVEDALGAPESKQATPKQALGFRTMNHFGVAVRDLERSVAFYRALTGEEPSGRSRWSSEGLGVAAGTGGKATITWAAFRLRNLNIDLLQVDEPKGGSATYDISQPGAMHICWEVATFARMEAAGIAFKGSWHRVSKAEDGVEQGEGVVVAYFDGPDGEHLELIQPAGPFVREEFVHEGR